MPAIHRLISHRHSLEQNGTPRQHWPDAPIVVPSERIDLGNCFDSTEDLGMVHHERGGPLRFRLHARHANR